MDPIDQQFAAIHQQVTSAPADDPIAKQFADIHSRLLSESEARQQSEASTETEGEPGWKPTAGHLQSVAFDKAQKEYQDNEAGAAKLAADPTNAANAPQSPLSNAWNAVKANALVPLGNWGSRLIENAKRGATEPTNLVNPPTQQNPQPQQPFQQAREQSAANIQQEQALHQYQARQLAPYDPNRTSGEFGAWGGRIAPVIAAGPLAPEMMLAQGYEGRAEDLENRELSGQQISGLQKAAYLGGGAVLDYGMGKLLPGQAANKAIMGELPVVANRVLNAGVRVGVGGAITSPEMGLYQTANNVLANRTGVDPNRTLEQDTPEASRQGLALGAAGEAAPLVHDLLGKLKAAQDARSAPPAEAPATPVASEVDHQGEQIRQLQERLAAQRATETGTMPEAKAEEATPKELLQHPRLPTDEHGPENPQAGESVGGLHTFESPEQVGKPASFERQLQVKEAQDRLAAADRTPRRQVETPVAPEDERRFDELTKGATFQTPEEAGASPLLAKMRGDQAVRETEGEPHPILNAAKNVFKRLASDEGGFETLDAAGKAFIQRDAVPTVKKVIDAGKGIARALDRHLDMGFSRTDEGKQSQLDLRKTLGDSILAGHAFEDAMVKTGAREVALKFSTDKDAALKEWDHIDDGGIARTPEEQAAQTLVQVMRQENAKRAKGVGVRLADEEGNATSRLFTFPDDAKKGSRSLAGSEAYRKSQTYKKASDAYRAAEAAGGKPSYDNMWDMQAARQYELGRSLSARENLRAADIGGTIRWFPDGTKPDPGFDTKIQDPVATETRKMAMPSLNVARFARLEGFEADKYLRDNADKMVDVRPGEDPPPGYAFTPKEVRGAFHAPEDTARTFNDMMGQGRGDPIETLPGKIARATILQRYGLSLAHLWNGTRAYLNQQAGTALSGLIGKGDTDAAQGLQAVKNATVYGGWKRGAEIQEEIEHPGTHPGLSEAAKIVAQSNPETKFKSVLDRPKLADAVEEFKAGNWQGGTARIAKTLIDWVPNFIYHGVLDKLDLSVRRDLAERQIREGKTQEEGAADLARAGDTISRALGRHVNSPAFKNSIITQVGKILFPAVQYKAGLLRNALIEPLRGNPHAQAQLVGSLITTAIGSVAVQAIMTRANTGKIQLPNQVRDYWDPRTGRTDANGHEERMTMPGYEAFLARTVGLAGTRGMQDELVGSLNPAITGAKETLENKDFYGNQVRPEGGSTLGNTARGAYHTFVRGALPISVMGAIGNNPEGDDRSWGMKLYQGVVGSSVSHPVTSDAEQTAYDILGKSQTGGRTPAEQASHDNAKKWIAQIRAGHEEEANAEMEADPTMTDSRAESINRRAYGQQGLAGLVSDTRFKPGDLLNIWSKATPEEQASMRDALESRLERAKPTSQIEEAAWQKLQDTMGEGQ